MMPSFRIAPATAIHFDMRTLRAEAASEGFGFVDRLIDDWLSAANRFEKPGELFFGGFREGSLVAACGLNRDPYTDRDQVGRFVISTSCVRPAAKALPQRSSGACFPKPKASFNSFGSDHIHAKRRSSTAGSASSR